MGYMESYYSTPKARFYLLKGDYRFWGLGFVRSVLRICGFDAWGLGVGLRMKSLFSGLLQVSTLQVSLQGLLFHVQS